MVLTIFSVITACSDSADEGDAWKVDEGTSPESAPIHTLLDTGLLYELPVPVTLYPKKGMDTASPDSLAPLIVVPKGSQFGVFSHDLIGKTPWYAVRILTGPQGGWKDVAGHPLDSMEILTFMAESRGLAGWINHRDLEGRPMRFTPYPWADTLGDKAAR